MLKLRRATVVSVESQSDRIARLTVRVEDAERAAIAYPGLTGPVEAGDEVVVNVEAQDLHLGSGGFDVVHANLSRLEGGGPEGDDHVMKLNYTSLQHAVRPIEEGFDGPPRELKMPAAVLALHGQLAAVAFGFAATSGGRALGYVQTAGGALPGALSDVVAALLESGLLRGHVTAGPSFGGEREAITVEGALEGGERKLGWDAAVVGPGPGIIGSASTLGHGGLAALSNAHAAMALGCRVFVVPRVSAGDPRERHQGVSHHSTTVLRLMLGEVTAVAPDRDVHDLAHAIGTLATEKVQLIDGEPVDELLERYRDSGLPARTMGRSIDEDPGFFTYALAAGSAMGRAVL